MNNIIIRPVEIDETLYNVKKIEPWVFPSLHTIIGNVAAGKSTLLYNLINDYWKPVFDDNIILFSSTGMNDPIIKKLIDEDKILLYINDFNMQAVESVLKLITEDLHNEGPYLLVFDDLLGKIADHKLGKLGHKLDQLLSTYRHQPREGLISLVFTSQYHKHLSPTMRSNMSYIYFLGSHSNKAIKTYAEEYSAFSGGDIDKFNELWKEAKKNKYDILMLDFRNLKAYQMGSQFKLLYDRDNEYNNDDDNNNNDNLNKLEEQIKNFKI